MTKLIVGLGNAGKKYEKTRHNVGFFIVDRLAVRHDCSLSRKKFKGIFGDFIFPGGEKIFFVKPATMMNLSGECVVPWLDFLNLPEKDVLVIHDELDFSLGRLKGQWDGGAGGHNGIASIMEHLGHGNFGRLRVGIGRPHRKSEVTDYVLSPFFPEQIPRLEEALLRAVDGVEVFMEKGLDPMMQVVNIRAQS